MRQFLFIFWILLGFSVLYIFSLNITPVDVDLYFVKFEQTSLVFVMLSSVFIGFLFGVAAVFVKFKKENLTLKKQIKALLPESTHSSEPQKEDNSKSEL